MSLYVDSSAFAARYITGERFHEDAIAAMAADEGWITSRLTDLEVSRALKRLETRASSISASAEFGADLAQTMLVDIDRFTIAIARDVATDTGSKSLDAIQLASALRVHDEHLRFLTFDEQQSRAAEQLGLRLAR